MPENSKNLLLPIRFRPQLDELFSSWLSRLAMAHSIKLHTFSSIIFSNRAIWDRDIDKSADEDHLAEMSNRTGIEISQLFGSTLRAYEGKLYQSHNAHGNSTWLLPVGVYRRTRSCFGLQMCPLCLREDADVPYFRRLWRVSWSTVCLKHKTVLLDRCPGCRSPIIFHRGDMGLRAQAVSISMSVCSVCGLHWTSNKVTESLKFASADSIDMQTRLEEVLQTEWISIKGFGHIHAIPFFDGLKQLLKLLTISRRSRRFRQTISSRSGIEMSAEENNYRHFDQLPVEARLCALQMAGWLLEQWKERLIETAEASGTYSSVLGSTEEYLPFWYWSPVSENLNRKTYQVTDEEIYSALGWIEKRSTLILPSDLENLIGRNLFEHKSNSFIISIYQRMTKHNQSCEKNRLADVYKTAREMRTQLNGNSKTKAIRLSQQFLRQHKIKPKGYDKAVRMYENLIDRYKCKERYKMVKQMETAQNATVVAAEFGVSPAIVTKWYRRYCQDGIEGLRDHSRTPLNFRHQIVFQKQENWIRILRGENLGLSEIRKELLNRYNFEISEGGLHRALKRLSLPLPCSKKNRFFRSNRKQVMSKRNLPQKKVFAVQELQILDLHDEGLNNNQVRREMISRNNFAISLNSVRDTLLKNGKRSNRPYTRSTS